MKKLKVLIASMIGAIALVFACVVGTSVKAEDIEYETFFNANTLDAETVYSSNSTVKSTDKLLKIETLAASATIKTEGALGSYTRGLYHNKSGSSTQGFKITNLSSSKLILKVSMTSSDSNYATTNNKTYYIGSYTGKTSSTAVTTVGNVEVEASASIMVYANSNKTYLYEVDYYVVVEKTFDSLTSISVTKSYQVGDTLSEDDLVVMAKYEEDESSVATSNYNFVVYKKVDGGEDTVVENSTFTAAGKYYVVATSTEGESSVTSATFDVTAQTRFVYYFDEYANLDVFNEKDSNKKYVAQDYNTTDGLFEFSQFKRYENTKIYEFTDGFKVSKDVSGTETARNGLQGSTMAINLSADATVTIYATQTNKNSPYKERCMYFTDEDDVTLVSDFCFSEKNDTITGLKVCSINLAKGTYNTHATDGSFNIFAIVIDYTNNSSLNTANQSMIMEHLDGTAIDGSGKAAIFVGVLKNIDYTDITSIKIDFTLTLNDANSTVKNASVTIGKVYTGLPGYDVKDDTLYFYFLIKGLEKDTYAGCTIKATTTIELGDAKGINSTTWTNA